MLNAELTGFFKCVASLLEGGCECISGGCSLTYPGGGKRQVAPSGVESFSIKDTTALLEIAKVHPRFATTLAKQGLAVGWNEVYWMPFHLTAEDVQTLLQSDEDQRKSLERRIDNELSELKGKEITPIIYEVNATREGDIITVVLKAKEASKLDPDYSSIRVDLTLAGKVNDWRIQ